MNFAPFNVLEFDGALSSVSIASWLPTFTQPGRLTIYAAGTDLASVQTVKVIPRIPDPWRATSARPGPAPRKGAVIREPTGIVSAPFKFAYQAPPAAPSNAGYTIVPVPDPWRSTSTPLYGPQTKPFILTPFLSWQPTYVHPGRPILRAAGTDHVKDVWRFPEAVSADKWQVTTVQPSRSILRASGTSSVDRLLEIVFADKWQPTTVQPGRPVVYARGTDSVLARELITADKWAPTWNQPVRSVRNARGTDFVTSFMEIIPLINGQTVLDTTNNITSGAGVWVDVLMGSALPMSVSLPVAGTYQMGYNARYAISVTGGSGYMSFRLNQSDTGLTSANSERLMFFDQGTGDLWQGQVCYVHEITVSAACTVKLQVKRDGTGTFANSSIFSDTAGYCVLTYLKVS